jgi:adenylate kinase
MKIIILGPPGCGKGTIATKLSKDFKLTHLSAGQILREEIKKETTIGNKIKKIVESGNLVPDQLVVEIMKLETSKKNNFILDGFPRTIEQAKAIKSLPINLVIYLEVPQETILKRLSGRRICLKGEHTYHIQHLPPKKEGFCDYDQTKLIQRKDDQPEVVRARFKVYKEETAPLVDYYKKKKIIKRIDATLKPKEVYEKVKILIQ